MTMTDLIAHNLPQSFAMRAASWVTGSAGTATKMDQALRDIGVLAPLNKVRVCGEPGNGKATA